MAEEKKKSLYDLVHNIVEQYELDESMVKRLRKRGYEVNQKTLGLQEEMQQNLTQYRNNPYIHRILKGEDPEKIIDGVVSQRKWSYKLPWNKGKREEFNKKVAQLEEITEVSDLKTNSIFSLNEPEGFITYSTVIASLFSQGLKLLVNATTEKEGLPGPAFYFTIDYVIPSIIFLWASLFSKKFLSWKPCVKKAKEYFCEEARYIYDKIGN